LDRIKDDQIIKLIEKIGGHYRANISNRFLRPVLLHLNIDKNTWDLIESLTEKYDTVNYQGFHLDELYRQIAACAKFIDIARNNMLPALRNKSRGAPNSSDRVLQEIAASNFIFNLQLLADFINELYIKLAEKDKFESGKRPPVYTQMRELDNIGRLLVGDWPSV